MITTRQLPLSLLEWINIRDWLLFSLVFLLIYDILKNTNPPKFPPGPWPIPFLGNIFHNSDIRTIEKLSEEFGDVFSLRKGGEKIVFVSGYKMVKEATQRENIADRPRIPIYQKVFKGLGYTKETPTVNLRLDITQIGEQDLDFHHSPECPA
ncbi:hypothetical protein GJAV_G00076440 [Gymnothorax javanicus]|nr:hypothetical protein GJAV_G00076440 [Gymnothorax javanicus]